MAAEPQASLPYVALCTATGRLALFSDNRSKAALVKVSTTRDRHKPPLLSCVELQLLSLQNFSYSSLAPFRASWPLCIVIFFKTSQLWQKPGCVIEWGDLSG